MFVDSHAHLYLDAFQEDREEVLERAKQQGVTHVFLPNIDVSTIDTLHQLEVESDLCHAMMGLHPCSVNETFDEELEIVKAHIARRRYAAIGEIGIDLHWDQTFLEQQKEAFKIQCQWARHGELPIVIHSRKSLDLLIDLLEKMAIPELSGIFHCFTGTIEQARRIIDLGFLIGIGGVVTFKNSDLASTLSKVDPKHVVLETDAPYLTPHPYRGRRNESAHVSLIAQALAQIYDMPVKEIGQMTSETSLALFQL